MTALQERLMLVLGETGRVAVTQKAILGRLQERWPTEHGYAAPFVEQILKELQAAGSIHCSPSGRWTRFLNLKKTETPAPAAPATKPATVDAGSFADQLKVAIASDDTTTQEIEVAGKTKVCTGKCGKEKPIGEFYAKCNQCKRCVLDRQKDLKAAKETGKPAPKAAAAVKAKPVKKNGNGAAEHSMVKISFALRIEDINGTFHEFEVARPTLARLVNDLKVHA